MKTITEEEIAYFPKTPVTNLGKGEKMVGEEIIFNYRTENGRKEVKAFLNGSVVTAEFHPNIWLVLGVVNKPL